MNALFDLLEGESEPSVRAVLGHWMFGYIHPYPDGNGRIARFLMNAMLASGGYPWTVIRVEDRGEIYAGPRSRKRRQRHQAIHRVHSRPCPMVNEKGGMESTLTA
jgi:Fic family protein